jgi:hypothetical protein
MAAALTPGGRCSIYAQYDYRNCRILAVGDREIRVRRLDTGEVRTVPVHEIKAERPQP